jgi:hypothetical protein
MARKSAGGVSQSSFIRDKLNANAGVKAAQVASAWKEAGHPGEIKSSLFYLVKNKMGLSKPRTAGRRRAAPAPAAVAAAPHASRESESTATYLEIEHTLDSLIHQADQLRNASLAEDLRNARRRVSIKLV